MELVKITEVAAVERARKGKIYPAGCTLIALAAAKGDVEYLETPQEVGGRYAVIEPGENIDSRYMNVAIQNEFPEFLHQWRTGINLAEDNLQYLEIMLCDMQQQKEIAKMFRDFDQAIRREEELVDTLKNMKKFFINGMFPA